VNTNIARRMQAEEPADTLRGGQAGFDGVLEPAEVAEACVQAMREERFWVLPHAEVKTYVERKANDVDRWLAGMRRFGDRIWEGNRPGDWLVR